MALSQASSKSFVEAAFTAYFGAPDDAAQAEKVHNAIAKAINDILLNDAVVATVVTTPDTINGTGTGTIS